MNTPSQVTSPAWARFAQNPGTLRVIILAGLLVWILQAHPGAIVRAQADTGLVPLALKGKLLFQDPFTTPTAYTKQLQRVAEGWGVRTAHADWNRIPYGIKSVWKTGHMPVLVYEGTFRDAVIEVDFRYRHEPEKWGGCRISATNEKLNPRAYAASVWAKTDSKERPGGIVLEHDEWSPGVITNVDYKKAEFKPDTWYTLRLELIGDKSQATCNGAAVYGAHEKFGLLPKTSLWLGVGTSTHELRNVRVYEARINPQWQAPLSTPIVMPAKPASSSKPPKSTIPKAAPSGGQPEPGDIPKRPE